MKERCIVLLRKFISYNYPKEYIIDTTNKDIDRIMEIWLESTIKAHDFIEKKYWEDNYNTVKHDYIHV